MPLADKLMRYGVAISYRMCDICEKKLGVQSVLGFVDKMSPAFELRNSDVPAVARSFQLPAMKFVRARPCLSITCRLVTAYH
jgi:hypothetical protein